MKYLLIIFLFTSCATTRTYRAYQRVSADAFVDQREGVLLSQKCLTVYPAIRDTPRVVSSGVDSSDYEAVIEAYNELLDSLIAQYERMDELAIIDTSATLPVDYIIRPKDSLRIIRNFLRVYKPPPIVKTITRDVPTINKAWQDMKQTEIEHCRAEKATLQMNMDIISAKLQKKKANEGWMIAGMFASLLVGWGVGKFIKF